MKVVLELLQSKSFVTKSKIILAQSSIDIG